MALGGNTKYGKILAEWQIPEFIKHERSLSWFYFFGGIAAILFVHAIASLNFLFAIILFLTASIVFMHERQEPDMLDFLIVETGVVLGRRYYPFKAIRSFWIVFEPGEAQILYLGVNEAFRKELAIHLENQNPIDIRNILLEYLYEDLDKEDESKEETLARYIKL